MIDREAVKTLAVAVGVREAARQLGLKETRVLQWSKRGKWFKPVAQPPKQGDVITVIKPSDAMAATLEKHKSNSKLHLAKFTEEASKEASEHPRKLSITGKAKDLASIHSTLWPEKEESGSGVMGGLRVYSQQTVIAVQTREDAREGQSDSKAG